MVAEAACTSVPWTIIPMVITGVQDYIAAGQFRDGEQLIDASIAKPGTILVFLEPIHGDGLADVTSGSTYIVNAYTSNHDEISSKETGTFQGFVLHAIDALGLVHALMLRIQAFVAAYQDVGFDRSLIIARVSVDGFGRAKSRPMRSK